MTRSRILAFGIAIVVASSAVAARQASLADSRYQAAMTKEVVDGKCDEAIAIYQQVLTTTGVTRATAAKALLQIGGCQERLSKTADALVTYQRIVSQHADSGAPVTKARERIGALQSTGNGPTERLITTDRTLGGLGGARWSPDGKFVIGMKLSASEFDGRPLVLQNMETAIAKPLFSRAPGHVNAFSAFSPDGTRYAAVMTEVPPQSEVADTIRNGKDPASVTMPGVLIVGSVAGSVPQRVIELQKMSPLGPAFSRISWSPDSRRLAVSVPAEPTSTFDLQIMDVTSGQLRSLGLQAKGTFEMFWSGSGRELLVHNEPVSNKLGELRVVNVETGDVRQLTLPGTSASRHRIVRWSPNGQIALRHVDTTAPKVEETYLLDAASGQIKKTCSGYVFGSAPIGGTLYATSDICAEITADGKRQIVWLRATKRLMVRDLSTGTDHPLTSGSGSEEYYGSLSPDDRVEVFVSNRDGRWSLYSAEVGLAPVAKPLRLSTFDDMPNFYVASWTKDGFIGGLTRNGSNVVRVNVDPATAKALGAEPERLTQDAIENRDPVISPDGKKIIYWSRQGTRSGLTMMDSNGANETILSTTAGYLGMMPAWRSNSSVVLLASPATIPPDPAVARKVFSLDTSTSVATLTAELSSFSGLWTSAQYVAKTDEIFHADPTFKSIVARSLKDGRTRVIAEFPGDQEVNGFLVAPDATKLAYSLARRYENGRACFTRSTAPVETVNQITTPCEIVQLNLVTGEKTLLATTSAQNAATPSLVAWSPDGRYLLFGGGRPQIVDTASTKEPKDRWQLLAQGTPFDWDWSGSWSSDGTFITLTTKYQHFEWHEWKGVR